MGTNAEEDVDVVEHADKPDKPDKEAFSSDSESDTEPEEEDDDDGGDGLPVKRQFDKIIADLKSGATDLPDLTLATAFVAERAALLVKKSKRKEQTLLHVLVEAELLPRKIKWLVTALVQLQPANLLAKQDVDFKTPLFSAVSLRQHRLARYMCEAHDDIDSILRIPRGQENQSPNCVHQAIANKATLKDDDLAEFLIRRSSEETLLALDQSGLTPLHLAVEYKRCDEAQVRIVKALVEKCDRALDTTVLVKKKGLKQKIPLSLYKYHEYTAPEASEKDKPAEKDRPERGDGESVERGTAVGPADGQKASSRGVFDNFKPTDHPDAFAPHGLHRVSTHSEAPTGKFGSSAKPSATDAARRGHITIPGPDGVRVGPGTPVVTREKDKNKDAKKGKGSSKSKSSRSRATPESAQEIKQFLKLHFLRKKTHDEALEFLYGPQADRQIYFDLTGMVSTLAESRITEGLSHIVCEDVLQYVAIPHVRVEPNLPVPSKRPPKPDGLGRTDLQILFRWLREDRKVKTILKVIVDDLQEPAHSDEAIEACLAGMGVETWDWKKTDVCPDVIGKVCPEVRVVHLYWSGNNAVLRGWGEPEGLRKLQKLEEVYLHVQPGRETRARTKRYVADFKARMESATRIKVLDRRLRGDPGESSSAADAARDPYERHRWIATMEEFAEFLQTAEKAADLTDKKANIRATSRRDITVALIDDGIDIGEQSIQSRIVGGRSFCSRDKQQNLNQPYYVSGGGHGTAMASLICKVCPNVRLYIYKLNEYIDPQSGKRQITAESAAKAVRAAVDKGVDIISMSWTIDSNDSNKVEIAELEKAIDAAAQENILMFCAATDQGAYRDQSYPAAAGTKRLFKIGAAQASGAAPTWLGDPAHVDFIFPGHQVVYERHGDPAAKQITALTGSSVATALAAGLAALVLYVVQAGAFYRDRAKPAVGLDDFRALKNHERMDEAFRMMGTTKESEHRYITVWNRFSKTVRKSEGALARDMWMDLVVSLAESLMREE